MGWGCRADDIRPAGAKALADAAVRSAAGGSASLATVVWSIPFLPPGRLVMGVTAGAPAASLDFANTGLGLEGGLLLAVGLGSPGVLAAIRSLCLAGCGLTDAAAACLAGPIHGCTQLEALDLSRNKFTARALGTLLQPGFGTEHDTTVEPPVERRVYYDPLRSLDLSHCRIGGQADSPAGLEAIGQAVVGGQLAALRLACCSIGPAGLAGFSAADGGLAALTPLTTLDLSGNRLTRTETVEAVVGKAKPGQSDRHAHPLVDGQLLVEASVDYDCSGWRLFVKTAARSNLLTLDLSRAGLGPEAAYELAQAGLGPKLRRLLLGSNYLQDLGLKFLGPAVAASTVETLDLSNNRLGDSAMASLANGYADVWAERSKLAGVDSAPQPLALAELDLSDNPAVGYAGKAALSPLIETVRDGLRKLTVDLGRLVGFELCAESRELVLRDAELQPADLLVVAGWAAVPTVTDRLGRLDLSGNRAIGGGKVHKNPGQAEIELFGLEALAVALGSTGIRAVSLARTALGPAAVELLTLGLGGPLPLHVLDLGGLRLGPESKAVVGEAVGRADLAELTIDLGFHAGVRTPKHSRLHSRLVCGSSGWGGEVVVGVGGCGWVWVCVGVCVETQFLGTVLLAIRRQTLTLRRIPRLPLLLAGGRSADTPRRLGRTRSAGRWTGSGRLGGAGWLAAGPDGAYAPPS